MDAADGAERGRWNDCGTELLYRAALATGTRGRIVFDGAGLYLLVTPNGGRYWRYNYRFNGKQKTLSLGVYPDVPLATARVRHQEAKRLLAQRIEPPSIKKQAFNIIATKKESL